MTVIPAQIVKDDRDLRFVWGYAKLQVALIVGGVSILARDVAVIADPVAALWVSVDVAVSSLGKRDFGFYCQSHIFWVPDDIVM
jgi:hypothetical protein